MVIPIRPSMVCRILSLKGPDRPSQRLNTLGKCSKSSAGARYTSLSTGRASRSATVVPAAPNECATIPLTPPRCPTMAAMAREISTRFVCAPREEPWAGRSMEIGCNPARARARARAPSWEPRPSQP